ncbi:19267_t:CDS:2, partial [Gigaspora margarita]
LNNIIHGKRENEIPVILKENVKIYEDCWQHDPNQRLDSCNDMMGNNDSKIPDDRLEMGNLSLANLLQHHTNLYNESRSFNNELDILTLKVHYSV